MLSNLHITNFKSIVDLNICLKKLTILSGLNSSGKSSIIQAIRILERYNHKIAPPLLPEYGDLKQLAPIPSKPVFFSCERHAADRTITSSYTIFEHESISMDALFLGSEDIEYPQCVYIGADRFGPRNILPTKNSAESIFDFGENCEYVYEFIERYGQRPIAPSVHHPQARGETLNFNIEAWLQEISPGVSFTTDGRFRHHSVVAATFDGHTPIHVGFGLSCVLPVIVAALGITIPYPGSGLPILLIENPEAHLHPQGQTRMAELIALSTQKNMQIVLETHSDHFIDGIRLAVKEGKINHKDVAIHYFKKEKDIGTVAESPELSKTGKLSFWPEGFGDQTMINRARLARTEISNAKHIPE